jgi:Family of unknown function (DUF6011)
MEVIMRLGTYNYNTGEATDTYGVTLGTFTSSAEAKEAMWAARLPYEFWHYEQVPPIPLLKDLYDWVIVQNEKRLPKWKFKLASNLTVQIQPKLTRAHALLFECIAIQAENPSLKLFTEPKSLRDQSYWRMKFELFHDEPRAEWAFKAKSAHRGHGCPSSGLIELRTRVIAALHADHFAALKPDLMLSPACLCCGKGLTDPVSMARWIGPECWGSASTNIPRIFKAEAPEQT